MARHGGIRRKLNRTSRSGSAPMPSSPLEMARAYSTFANDGPPDRRLDLGNRATGDAPPEREGQEVVVTHRASSRPTKKALLTGSWRRSSTEGTGKRAALARQVGRRQDRHDGELRRRMVRRVHAAARPSPSGSVTRRELMPMETEYHGDPVAGGTFPARDLARVHAAGAADARTAGVVPVHVISRTRRRSDVVWRDGRSQLDNGYCRCARHSALLHRQEPSRTANCKPNEVDVPGSWSAGRVDARSARLAAQPLTPKIVYRPARADRSVDLVLGSEPAQGARCRRTTTVTLVVGEADARGRAERDRAAAARRAQRSCERRG